MSDVFEGPGWWIASDGKWYPPEHHPDERYRARFAAPDEQPIVEPPLPSLESVIEPEVDVPEISVIPHITPGDTETIVLADLDLQSPVEAQEFPTVELRPEPDVAEKTSSFSDLARAGDSTEQSVLEQASPAADQTHTTQMNIAETAELSGADLANEMTRVDEQRATMASATDTVPVDSPTIDSSTADSPAGQATAAVQTPPVASQPAVDNEPLPTEPSPTFSVASREFTEGLPERPVFDDTLAPSVVEAPQRESIGHTEIEIDRPIDTTIPTGGSLGAAKMGASVTPSTSTALVHVPNAPLIGIATPRDRLISTLLFIGGVTMIVGSFLNWTAGDLVQSGWERGEGIVTVLAGILGASMGGPIFVGFRHAVPKAVAIISGAVALVVLGLVAVNSVTNTPGIDFGVGIYVVAAGAVLTLIAGIADQGEILA